MSNINTIFVFQQNFAKPIIFIFLANHSEFKLFWKKSFTVFVAWKLCALIFWIRDFAIFSVLFYFILLKMGIKLNASIILNLWKDRICCRDFLPLYANFMRLELFMFHLRRKGDFLVYFAEYPTTGIQFPMCVAINRLKSSVGTCTKHEILYLFIQREVWQK